MGQFTEELSILITQKMEGRKKMPRNAAFAQTRRRILRSALEFDRLLEDLYKLWDWAPPESQNDRIKHLQRSAAIERERVRDLDELEASGFKR